MMYRTTNCLKLDSSESAQPQYVGLKEQLHYLNTTDTLKPVVPADIGNLEKQLFDSIIVRPDSSLCATYINYCSGLDSIHEIRIRKIDNDYKAYHEVVVASPGFKIRECEKYCTAVKNGEIPGYFYKTVFRKLENLSAQIVFQSCDSVAYAKYLEKYPMCSRSIRSGMQARLKELSDLNHAITIDTYSAYQKFIQEYASSICMEKVKNRLSVGYWENHARTDMDVWFSLTSAYIASFQYKNAEKSLKSALQRYPSNPEPAERLAMFYDGYGSLYLPASTIDSSGKYYAEAIRRKTRNSKVYFMVASRIQGKDRQQAIQYLDKSIELDSSCKHCRSLRKEILEMGK